MLFIPSPPRLSGCALSSTDLYVLQLSDVADEQMHETIACVEKVISRNIFLQYTLSSNKQK